MWKRPACWRSAPCSKPAAIRRRACGSCSAKPPRAARRCAEVRILLDLAQRRLDYYKKHPEQAATLIAIGASKRANVEATELAAWTMVASTILNLDETITKE